MRGCWSTVHSSESGGAPAAAPGVGAWRYWEAAAADDEGMPLLCVVEEEAG